MKFLAYALFLSLFIVSCGETGGNAPGVGSCEGAKVGGYCWYLGADGADCDSTCLNHGGYNNATLTYAAVNNSQANCLAVLNAISAPGTSLLGGGNSTCTGTGCYYYGGASGRIHCTSPAATSSATLALAERACACNE